MFGNVFETAFNVICRDSFAYLDRLLDDPDFTTPVDEFKVEQVIDAYIEHRPRQGRVLVVVSNVKDYVYLVKEHYAVNLQPRGDVLEQFFKCLERKE